MAAFRITVVFCVIILTKNARGIVNIDQEKKQKIDSYVNSLLFECDKYRNVAGMTLAIAHKGEILYTTGYGVKNLDTKEPVTDDTVYGIGSVTKQFTSILLGQTMKNTGYSWDTKVHDILKDLGTEFYFYDFLRTNLTSVRDLGSHSTGLAPSDYLWVGQNMSRSELMARLRFIEGVGELRTTYIYNNLMFTLLGHILELLAGTKWEELMQTKIFKKVGMVNSSISYYINEDLADLATPYIDYKDKSRKVDWQSWVDTGDDIGPAGSIVSTANDIARWMNMLLAGGLNEAGEEVFSSDVIRETQSPVNAHSSSYGYYPPEYPISYNWRYSNGLGFNLGSYRGYRAVSHTGGSWGHYSTLEMFPDIGLGIYSATNGLGGRPSIRQLVGLYAADIILDNEPWLNATTACMFPFGSHKKIEENGNDVSTLPSSTKPTFEEYRLKDVKKFIGRYGNFAAGNLTITVNDTLEELIVNFDAYACIVRNVDRERKGCFGWGIFWFLSIWRVEFDEKNNPCKFVDVTFTVVEDPVRFERDLLFEDAPGPRDHWPQCDQICRSRASQSYGLNKAQMMVILALLIWKLV